MARLPFYKDFIKRFNWKVRNFILFRFGAVPRLIKRRVFPENKDGRILVHFGCGIFNNPKYINVDSRPGWHIHHVNRIENCEKLFPPGSVDLIYCCHIVEHVSHLKIPEVFKSVYACLKKGGIFRISVPNFETIVNMYLEKRQIEDIMEPLMGGQGYAENFHASVFDERFLKNLLTQCGFREVRHWTPGEAIDHSFADWSGRPFPLYGKEWPLSLNLEAVK